MKFLIQKINERIGTYSLKKITKFIDNFYIKKYGSREKAEAVFQELKNNCKSDAEFVSIFNDKIKKDLHVDSFTLILKPFLRAKNISSLIKNLYTFKHSQQSKQLKVDGLAYDYKNLIEPAFEEALTPSAKTKSDVIALIGKNLKLTLASTRKELGYPDPRTFNPWLNVFFGGKYEARAKETGRSAGVISLFEYIEIVSAFMLSYDEHKLDFSNIDKLHKRFTESKKTQKKVLKQLTKNNYSRLKEKLPDMEWSSYNNKIDTDINLKDESTYRNIPFSIVSIIKEELKLDKYI